MSCLFTCAFYTLLFKTLTTQIRAYRHFSTPCKQAKKPKEFLEENNLKVDCAAQFNGALLIFALAFPTKNKTTTKVERPSKTNGHH